MHNSRDAANPPDVAQLAPLAGGPQRWIARFLELRSWLAARQGEYPRERSANVEEVRLARWVRRQRQNDLTDWQRDHLRNLPAWSWDPLRDRFDSGYFAAREFIDQRGHRPRRSSEDAEERAAGQFLYRIRRRTDLTDYMAERLNDLDAAAKFGRRTHRVELTSIRPASRRAWLRDWLLAVARRGDRNA